MDRTPLTNYFKEHILGVMSDPMVEEIKLDALEGDEDMQELYELIMEDEL
jgi:hypothetical protein